MQDLIKAMKQLQHDDSVPEQTRELINQVRRHTYERRGGRSHGLGVEFRESRVGVGRHERSPHATRTSGEGSFGLV